ncbi:hypothetical protein A3Q37_00655 [Streptomyces sp. PTY087I2]|nr:hypothetical protein A3Q37_00655 [Streptomyces sp. PTY087I2]
MRPCGSGPRATFRWPDASLTATICKMRTRQTDTTRREGQA